MLLCITFTQVLHKQILMNFISYPYPTPTEVMSAEWSKALSFWSTLVGTPLCLKVFQLTCFMWFALNHADVRQFLYKNQLSHKVTSEWNSGRPLPPKSCQPKGMLNLMIHGCWHDTV